MRLIDADAAIAFVDCGYLRPPTELAWSDKDVVDMLKRIPSAQPYSLDEWCDTCKEYDQERHCCPRFNRVIRETLDDVRKEAYKHGKSKGIKRGMAMARRKEAGDG